MKKSLISFLSLCCFLSAFAQSDLGRNPKAESILLINGERLVGSVQYDSIKSIVYFQEESRTRSSSKGVASGSRDRYRIIPKDSIAEFINEKIQYENKTWKGEQLFAIRLVNGKYSLYKHNNFYFIESANSQFSITESTFSQDLAEVYSNNCNWDYNANNLKFTEDFLIHIVKGYNKKDCFKVQQKKMGIRISGGSAQNNLLIQTEQLTADLENSGLISFGAQAEFPTYKGSSIVLALDYLSQDIENDFPIRSFDDIFLNVSHLILRPGIKYYINDFFVEVGILVVYTFSDNSFVTYNQRPDFITTFGLDGTSLGFNGALGYQVLNNVNNSLSLEVRHSTFSGSNLDVATNTFGLFFSF